MEKAHDNPIRSNVEKEKGMNRDIQPSKLPPQKGRTGSQRAQEDTREERLSGSQCGTGVTWFTAHPTRN
jgi:hypothetical protein